MPYININGDKFYLGYYLYYRETIDSPWVHTKLEQEDTIYEMYYVEPNGKVEYINDNFPQRYTNRLMTEEEFNKGKNNDY